ncbi:MAG: hypothetical protein AB7F59_12915 [Bdellovibrionales bacterium]
MLLRTEKTWLHYLIYFQSIFYAITALWAFVDMQSFMHVTGPKTDTWLVHTVSWLILAIAFTLFSAATTRSITFPIAVLGIFSSSFLAGVDIYFSMSGVIRKVYLLDAVVEFFILFGWIFFFSKSHFQNPNSPLLGRIRTLTRIFGTQSSTKTLLPFPSLE